MKATVLKLRFLPLGVAAGIENIAVFHHAVDKETIV
jgi:hypothetical protein